MNSMLPRLGALALGTILLTAAYNRTNSASVMTEAANRFLASLSPEQKAKATFKFDDAERMNWFFVPIERKGLPLREMSAVSEASRQRAAERGPQPVGVHEGGDDHEPGRRAARDGEGQRRAAQSREILLLDLRHARRERDLGLSRGGPPRQPELHDRERKVVDGPSFFGANPAEVREGPRAGLRVLAAEEDLGTGPDHVPGRRPEEDGDLRREGAGRHPHHEQPQGRDRGAALGNPRIQAERRSSSTS